MSDSNQTSQERDSELLTAYLDGELPDAECIAVEKRLSEDTAFRSKMNELQSAWDMLDSLPLVRPKSQFVNTTVEMAIASDKVAPKSASLGVLKTLFLVAVPAIVFATGYLLKRESIEEPERKLVSELPLIENYERYKKVIDDKPQQGIEFLQAIDKNGTFTEVDDLFLEKPKDNSIDSLELGSDSEPLDNVIQARSDRISRMSPQQREELERMRANFDQLPQSEQEKLREFHQLLSNHPDRDRLSKALVSYIEWLKIISMTQRAKLSDTKLADRLDQIEKITAEQAQKFFGTIGSTKLPEEDAVVFYRWFTYSISMHQLELRQRVGEVLMTMQEEKAILPGEGAIERIKRGPIERLVEFLMQNSPADREFVGNLLCKKVDRENVGIDFLLNGVTNETRELLLDSNRSWWSQRELILRWIESANETRFPIKTTDLKSFYSGLSEESRDQLNSMDPEQWYDELSRMYWKKNIGDLTDPEEFEDFENLLQQSGWSNVFNSIEGS